MPKISFSKPFSPVEVAPGANLMQSLLAAGVPVASSCYGDGVCGKCRLQVIAGGENLSPEGDLEKILKDRYRLGKEMRISCQTAVNGDVTVDAGYW
jgi:ferredoxin, 2Fe-2S